MAAPSDFVPRCYYYNAHVALTAILSEERFAETDQEREVNKTNEWLLTELSSLEVALITDDDQLGARGKKRPASFTPGPAKGPRRPPQSDTAKPKAEAEARKELELQSKGSSKGKSKDESVKGKSLRRLKGKDSGKGKSFEPTNQGQSKGGIIKGTGKGKPKERHSRLPSCLILYMMMGPRSKNSWQPSLRLWPTTQNGAVELQDTKHRMR